MTSVLESKTGIPFPHPLPTQPARRWTATFLAGLDWNRIVELARALASASGFEASDKKVFPDGGTEFSMVWRKEPWSSKTLVRIASWNQWMVSVECVTRMDHELKFLQKHRGIFIAPGGFTPAALNYAKNCGIETVDAETLVARLNEIPVEHQEYFFTMGTSGNATTPSCPHCLRPLEHTAATMPHTRILNRLPDLSFDRHEIVADPIVARRIEVLRHGDVQFLHGVRARDLIVHGVVSGDFVCQGGVLLNPGAVLNGNVAARSIVVRPGAELNGQARIIDGNPESASTQHSHKLWRCVNPTPHDKCWTVEFVPHE